MLSPVIAAFATLALLQQQPAAPQLPRSPVARIVVTPAAPVLASGDSIRLTAVALDSAGRPMANVLFRFETNAYENYNVGEVDSSGLFRAGTPGRTAPRVVALVSGAQPKVQAILVHVTPGVAAQLRIDGAPSPVIVGEHFVLAGHVVSAAGDRRSDMIAWESADQARLAVGSRGEAVALAPGRARIIARAGGITATANIDIVADDVVSIDVSPPPTTVRQGEVVRFVAKILDGKKQEVAGLRPRWSLSPGGGLIGDDGAFVGYDVGTYTVTAAVGSHARSVSLRVVERDVRRPPVVVGRLLRNKFTTSEVWIHPGGAYAYLGTAGGSDRMYVVDIRDPAAPVVTDSLVVDTKTVNDIKTTPDGKVLILTREFGSRRKDGIVLASLEDPAHPKVIGEFTDGVTSGVHSIFVDHQAAYGTHLFLTNDGTGAIDVVNIDDPHHPRRVGSWGVPRTEAGRTVHDLEVRDGLLYAAYWNDGVVILDVGNGMRGGTPAVPILVTQYKYDLDSTYRDVIREFGPDYIRGTHAVWPHGKYLFVADEVFTIGRIVGAAPGSNWRTFSRLHVLDISDITRPKPVAWYEPEVGGVHNLWVAGDTLYLGAYEGGFHAFDISGELRGDLRAQHREIAYLNPVARDGLAPYYPFTWGAIVRDGLVYITDMHSGLWIVRLGASRLPVP